MTQAPANLPLFTARSPGGADVRLRTLMWDDTHAAADVPSGLMLGPYELTVTVNGVPSGRQVLWVGAATGSSCSLAGDCLTRVCDAGLCSVPFFAPIDAGVPVPDSGAPAPDAGSLPGACEPLCSIGCGCTSTGFSSGLWICIGAVALFALRKRR